MGTIGSVEELIQLVELSDIQFEEVSAGKTADSGGSTGSSDEIAIKFDITEAREGSALAVRVAASLMQESISIRVTAVASYAMSTEREIPRPVVEKFIENIAFFSVYPYLRSTIHSLSTLLGERQIVLPIIRVGQISLSRE